jgi:hypothetical protein
MATTGLRRAEVLGLRWSDLDLDRGRLRVVRTVTEVRGRLIIQQDGKTNAAQRSLALDPRTLEALQRWKVWQTEERLDPAAAVPSVELMFTREDGEGHRPKRVSSAFTATTDRLGLPRIGVHGLRHSYATAALRAGVSPEVVSKRLGHSSVVITLSLYAHVFEQDDQAAADSRRVRSTARERMASEARVMGGSWGATVTPATTTPRRGCRGVSAGHTVFLRWCAREDLNLHPVSGTRPSTVRVCLFRHSRVTRATGAARVRERSRRRRGPPTRTAGARRPHAGAIAASRVHSPTKRTTVRSSLPDGSHTRPSTSSVTTRACSLTSSGATATASRIRRSAAA